VAVDEILGSSSKNDLSGDANGGIFFESDRRLLGFSVVEDDRDTGFRYPSLAALVYQILHGR
jgi:hypothetical protein